MYTETNVQEEHLFTEEDVLGYEDASLGKRFLNFLIDGIIIQYGLAFLTGIGLGIVLTAISPELAADFFAKDNAVDFLLTSYGLTFLNFMIYYTICERYFNGYTLGKRITGTKAVRTDGSPLTLKDALLRSLCRLIPFEALSAFGRAPWHDSITNTTVVKTR